MSYRLKQWPIWAIVFVTLAVACATDDPIEQGSRWNTSVSTTSNSLSFEISPASTTVPPTPTTVPPSSTTSTTTSQTLPPEFDDVPIDVAEAIWTLWPQDHWDRAVRISWCESRWQLDAANPYSSARGVFQLLAPWTRDPGTGRTVWGWDYTDEGEKLSAAASLGIGQRDARYGLGNITVAHSIWEREGWEPWAASRICWMGMP
jgi:hypothetical protein